MSHVDGRTVASAGHVDGRTVASAIHRAVDVVIVGSGPAGSAVARAASARGARVAVVEAGPWLRPDDFAVSAFGSMAASYRDMGASVVLGPALAPFAQLRGRHRHHLMVKLPDEEVAQRATLALKRLAANEKTVGVKVDVDAVSML